jgi:hypothetical protein
MRKSEEGIFAVSRRMCFPQPPKNQNFGEPPLAQRVYICSTRRKSTPAERALSGAHHKTVIFIQNLVPARDSAIYPQSFDKLIVDLSGSSRQGLLSGIPYVISYECEFPTGVSVSKSSPELASDLEGATAELAHNFRKALPEVRRTQVAVEDDNQTIVCRRGKTGSATRSRAEPLEMPCPFQHPDRNDCNLASANPGSPRKLESFRKAITVPFRQSMILVHSL